MPLPQDISTLSQAEKLSLLENIWDSLDKDSVSLTPAQRKELDRRLLPHQANVASCLTLTIHPTTMPLPQDISTLSQAEKLSLLENI